jgi:hypothetical protein
LQGQIAPCQICQQAAEVLEMGCILQANYSCADISLHSANEMQEEMMKFIFKKH